jgi:hypothetical protein
MKWLKRIGFGLAAFVTLIALVIAFENWRGKRAWLKFKHHWESKGEVFDVAAFMPPKVPDHQNFAMTPFFAPLFDYEYAPYAIFRDSNALQRTHGVALRGKDRLPKLAERDKSRPTDLKEWQDHLSNDTNFSLSVPRQPPAADILRALARFDPVIEELRAASARPYSHYPVHYHESFSAHLQHLSVLRSLADLAGLRVVAQVDQGLGTNAFADLKLCLYLGESLKSEPLLISQLVRIALLKSAFATLWETLDRWNDDQLTELQRRLAEIDVLSDYPHALRGERVFSNDVFVRMRRGEGFPEDFAFAARYGTSGFLYQNQLTVNRLHQKYSFTPVDVENRRVDARAALALDHIPELKKRHPYRLFAHLLFPALSKAVLRFTEAQTDCDFALLAVALERHRRAHGSYPETLEQLTPRLLPKTPHDLITGGPLHYRRMAANDFVLYAVGFNEKDDNGTPAERRSNAPTDGDWVWKPAPKRIETSANR